MRRWKLKYKNTLLGNTGSLRISANSHSITFGYYRVTKSSLKQRLKRGRGQFCCWNIPYRWKLEKGGISESNFGYRVSPATYKKIVKWSKSK